MSEKKDKTICTLWDALFTFGMLSFLKDSHEAQTDEKKFKQMLLQMIFGIIFAVSLFAMIFWWIS